MAIGLALGIQALVVKPFQIPSESMKPLLVEGERVLVNRLSYTIGGDPSIGDVVVFHPPDGADDGAGTVASSRSRTQVCPEGTDEPSEQNFIKRIVAGPGDELYIEDGHPVVNGEMAEEDFIRECGGGSFLQFQGSDHHPARPLLHDGRQPWIFRRQPLLGTRPRGLDHRQRPSSPTGLPQKSAPSSGRQGARRRSSAASARPRSSSSSTASSASATSPAATRPAAARSRARWSPRPS